MGKMRGDKESEAGRASNKSRNIWEDVAQRQRLVSRTWGALLGFSILGAAMGTTRYSQERWWIDETFHYVPLHLGYWYHQRHS